MNVLDRQPIRLSADVGGTFTDVAAFDETTGELRLGKTLTTPSRLVDGIENGVGKAGAAVSRGAAVPARHHGRDQHHPGAHRRALRADHHAGLPRHLRDRPRQPAGILQPVLQAARAADRPRPALRDPRAHGRAGHGADPARRGAGARGGRARGGAGRAGDRHPVPALLSQSGARAARQGDHRRDASRSCSSPPRTSCRRSTASSSAPRRPPPTPMSGRACGAISARWASISTPPASAANS